MPDSLQAPCWPGVCVGLESTLSALKLGAWWTDDYRMTRLTRPVAAVAMGAALFLVMLRLPLGGPLVARTVDDVGQLLAATFAAVCGWRRSRRVSRPLRRSWQLLAMGSGCWACGEGAWSYYELLAHRETPFPSAADAGFLLFPALAGAGLLLWPSVALLAGRRWRTLLDGTLVAGSLFLLSWVTALGSTIRVGQHSFFAYLVAVAYPGSDLVLLTMTVIVVAHAKRAAHSGLVALSCGLACLCVADSGFAYLTATGRYHTGSVVDAGWVAGFLLIAVAGCDANDATGAPDQPLAATSPTSLPVESAAKTLLPYVPAGVGLAAGLVAGLTGQGSTLTLLAAALVVAALLGRQLLAIVDNRRLVRQVVTAQQTLHHQAFHDSLTGLANRTLFTDRLRHGLELHRRDLRPLTLLYCDLDGFKTVNDTLGHDAGDIVLKAAAERLQAVTRRGDTVARLGGDEFAILLEDGGDAAMIAGRILDGFARPITLDTHDLAVGVSIGIAALDAACPSVSESELLRRADSAMYVAKHNGKGTTSIWRAEHADPPAALHVAEL
jgi:diguanylate cyclase (GGDEF)-like protein